MKNLYTLDEHLNESKKKAMLDKLILKMKPGSTIKIDGEIRTKDKYGNWRHEDDENDILVNRDIAQIANDNNMKVHKSGNFHITESVNEGKNLSKKEVRDLKIKIHNARTIGKYFTKDEVEFLTSLFESTVNEAEKYNTKEFKVGDKIKTNIGVWEVIETDYKPGKSFAAPFIFKGKDMKRVNIPNPPKTNKNAVGYKVTDGDKYPIIGFLYQYKDITKLATVGVDESVNEAKDKVDVASLSIGNTYKDNKGYPVKVIDIKGTGNRWKVTYQYEDGKKKTVSTSLDKGINLYESINELGPMRGSGNRRMTTRDAVARIGDLEDILWNGGNRRAEKEWEIVSGEYLTGEEGAKYWGDLDDDDLRSAIDDAEHIMKKYKMKEPDQQGGYGRNESVNEADVMHGEYLMQMLKAQAEDLKKQGEPKTAAAMMYLWDRINQSARDVDLNPEDVHSFLNEPRGRKHSQNLPEWMILDLFVESYLMKEELEELNESMIGIKTDKSFKPADLQKALDKAKVKYKMNRLSMTLTVLNLEKEYFDAAQKVVNDLGLGIMMAKESLNEGQILAWDELEKPFDDLLTAIDKIGRKSTDPKWSKAILTVYKMIRNAEDKLNQYDNKLGAIETNESVNEGTQEKFLMKGLTSKDINTLDILADDVSDVLSNRVRYDRWVKMSDKEKSILVTDALDRLSDKYMNDKVVDNLVKKKYDAVIGYIVHSLSESVNEKKVPPNDETIKFHIDSYRVDDDPYDVAKEIGSQYNWTEKEIEKAEKIIRKKYLK